MISQPHSKTNLTDLHKILNEKDETESLFRKHSVDGKINLETFWQLLSLSSKQRPKETNISVSNRSQKLIKMKPKV